MKIVLLSYLNRSGSTYLINHLSKSDDICVCPEADILYELLLTNPEKIITNKCLNKWTKLFKKDEKFKRWEISIDEVVHQKHIGLRSIEYFIKILTLFKDSHYPNSTILIFKQNYLYKLLNHNIRVKDFELYWISMVRDPRAIYASQKDTITPQTGKLMANNPLHFILSWNKYYVKINKISSKNHLIIHYEVLIRHFVETSKMVFEFLSIPIPKMDLLSNSPKVFHWLGVEYKKIHENINKPPLISSINKWEELISHTEKKILESFCVYNCTKSITHIPLISYLLALFWFLIRSCITHFMNYLRLTKFKIEYLP